MSGGVAHGLHGLALDAHRRGELERAARLMARAARLDASLLPVAEELNAQAAAAAGAAEAEAEAEAEALASAAAFAPAGDAAAPLAPPAAACAAGGGGEARRELPPRPRVPWRAPWGVRLAAALAAALLLLLHEAAGLRLLPRRGSAAFTALAAAAVALPLARALPTTTSRRRAALLSAGGAAPASPTRAPRRHAAATVDAQARAADAWLRRLAAEAGFPAADDTDRGEDASPSPGEGADVAEVRRVLRAGDHFAVLNLRRDATAAAARRAYRRAALLLHPDKTRAGLEGAPAAWERVQAAGAALADDAARGEYAAQLWRAEAKAQAQRRQAAAPVRRRARRWAGLI